MIQAKLRQFIVRQGWAAHDALDEDLVRVAGEKVATGELSADKYFELTESEKADDAEAKAAVDAHFAGVEERLDAMHEFSETKQFKNLILDRLRLSDDDEDDDDEEEDEIMTRHFQGGDSTALFADEPRERTRDTSRDYHPGSPNTKAASARYSNVRYPAKHSKTGQVLRDRKGEELLLPSERELAIMGAIWKQMAVKAGLCQGSLSEHEKELLADSFRDTWVGQHDGKERFLSGAQAKTIFSESSTGGIFVNPSWFDSAVITPSLLNQEVLPYVNRVEMPRGDNIETARIDHPTVTWAENEQTPMTEFDPTDLINQITASVHAVSCVVIVGRDMLSDAAVDLGRILAGLISERMGEELDRVICNGNGTTEPLGLFSGGSTVVPSTNGSSGSFAIGDVENMMKTLGKQYRANKGPSLRWLSNDTSYWRLRGLPVGAGDARRLFGQDWENYMLAGRPYSIQNDIHNTRLFFGDLAKYRLYSRNSFEQRWVDGGKTLALANEAMLLIRGRFGGRYMLPDAGVVMTTAPH
jgi:HK97 family phage major capsid protein